MAWRTVEDGCAGEVSGRMLRGKGGDGEGVCILMELVKKAEDLRKYCTPDIGLYLGDGNCIQQHIEGWEAVYHISSCGRRAYATVVR